jgi:signal transduction histidine kinase
MSWSVPSSFRAQMAIISIASAAMLGLAALLIRDVVLRTEGRLLTEARQQCIAACNELKLQYQERAVYGEDTIAGLPIQAQDVSLRGLSSTVLRSYEGVEGGFRLRDEGGMLGYAFPTNSSGTKVELTPQETTLVAAVAASAKSEQGIITRTREWNRDVAIVAAAWLEPDNVTVWTMKRLTGVHDPVLAKRRWLFGALVASALLGMAGIVSVWFFLRSGVTAINTGLRRLEQDFAFRLPRVPGEFGEISKALNHMADRRMALEAELRRQDRLAALGKVVSGVAHEIRNPLNSMRLTLELLQRKMNKGTANPDEVKAAVEQIDRLDLILSRLLAFGRPALQDRQVQNVAAIVHDASKMVREQSQQKGVHIAIESAEQGELLAEVDGLQITQVLINLLLNAIEASPPSGRVDVKTWRDDANVFVAVTDQGPGVSREARSHVFDAYFTTKPDGTGLGLAVSREIVANHNGELDFRSGPKGTTFQLRLPAERSS